MYGPTANIGILQYEFQENMSEAGVDVYAEKRCGIKGVAIDTSV